MKTGMEHVITQVIHKYGEIVNWAENDKSLGKVNLISDMINSVEIHRLFFETSNTRFVLEFIIFRSLWYGAYTIYNRAPTEI